jgi:hypothetical protein
MYLVFLALVLALSLPLLVFTVGDRATARRFGAALVALCVVELLLALRWILPGERMTFSTLGTVLTVLYSSVLVLGGIVALLMFGLNGGLPEVPQTATVLPLPAGVSIASNMSGGCGGGSETYCTRDVYLVSDDGLPEGAIVQEMAARLAADGWRLTGDSTDGWSGCRSTGILLDRGSVCVVDSESGGKVSIELDWGGTGW